MHSSGRHIRMASQAWMSFLQILERTFSKSLIVCLSPFFLFIFRRQDADAGVNDSVKYISNFTFNINTLYELLIKSLFCMKTRLSRKDDIAVVYRTCKAFDKGIVMLKAYSVAVDPSRINKFILL